MIIIIMTNEFGLDLFVIIPVVCRFICSGTRLFICTYRWIIAGNVTNKLLEQISSSFSRGDFFSCFCLGEWWKPSIVYLRKIIKYWSIRSSGMCIVISNHAALQQRLLTVSQRYRCLCLTYIANRYHYSSDALYINNVMIKYKIHSIFIYKSPNGYLRNVLYIPTVTTSFVFGVANISLT